LHFFFRPDLDFGFKVLPVTCCFYQAQLPVIDPENSLPVTIVKKNETFDYELPNRKF
jgi:hypothetical protein